MCAQRVTRSRDGVEIAYATHGVAAGAEAPAVVLVHGWAGNRTYWDQQVGDLGERNLVVAVDLGGHGGSGLGRAEWSLAAFGDDVVAYPERGVAWVATRHPERPVPEGGDQGVIARFELASDD